MGSTWLAYWFLESHRSFWFYSMYAKPCESGVDLMLTSNKLCGALGPAYRNSSAEYEAAPAAFRGSWAFLIGSLIQW